MLKRRELILSLKNSELLVNTSILISGTAIAQLIPVLLQPILRRYYSPETFGAYSVYLSFVGIFAIIASVKYDLAIILPRRDKDAANIFFLSVIISFVLSILFILVIIIWDEEILRFVNLPEKFKFYLYFVPLGIFFYSFYQSINNWLTRQKAFLPISINKFVRRGVEGAAQIGFKFINSSNGIIYGDILGHVSNVFSGLWQGKKKGLTVKSFSPVKIRYLARKYATFPKYNVIPSFMSACSFLLPAIMLNKFYSTEMTGYFDLSKLLLSIPLALISTSISNVLLQSLSEKYRNKTSFKKDLFLMFAIVFSISIFEVLIISFFGIGLFKFFFGEQWGFSGRISQILVWSYALNFVVASFSAIFISMDKIKLLSIWQVLYFMSILSLIIFRKYEFISFLRVYVAIEIFAYLLMILLMVLVVFRYEKKFIVQTG